MDKNWISRLANDIERKHGKEMRDHIFGDFENIKNTHKPTAAWFANFTKGLDELNDRKFAIEVLIKQCPCTWKEAEREKSIRESYEKSNSFEEFVLLCDKTGVVSQIIEYEDNIIYLLKKPRNKKTAGKCGKGCHCSLASHTEVYASDLFCHCCTVGFDGRPFRKVFGDDIRIEFIESFITNGNPCKTAVYIPKKVNW